jgi:hypothetical protein
VAEPEELTAEVSENETVESPDNVVVDNQEEATPQASDETEEYELSLGDSDEQESQPEVPVRKFNKMRKRAQKAEKAGKSTAQENEELKRRLAEVEGYVAKASVGPKPNPDDFYDVAEYAAAVDKHSEKLNSSARQPQQQQQAQQETQQRPVVDESFLNSHYERAEKLPVSEDDFVEAENSFRNSFDEEFGDDGNLLANLVLKEAGAKSDVVALALGKSPKERNKLITALKTDLKNGGGNSAVKAVWELSQKAALKPKRKRVETQPDEVPAGGSGNADMHSKQVDKAYDAWLKDPSIANHRKLKAVRKAKNG